MVMAIIADEEGSCSGMAIPSFPNLLYTVFSSSNASPIPDIFSTSLFFIADCQSFLLTSAVKDARCRCKYITSSAAYTRPHFSTIVFVKGQSVTQNLFFVMQKHLLMHLVR